MNLFWYEATNADGVRLTGEIEAETVAAAVQLLVQQGLSLRAIQQVPVEAIRERASSAEFDARISKLVERKGEWLPALRAMADELPAGGVRNEMQRLISEIEGEVTVSEFLSSRYAAMLLPLLASGLDASDNSVPTEHSTDSAHRFHDWLSVLSKQIEDRVRRRNAWVYPTVLIVLVSLAAAACLVLIVPIFKAMFIDFGLSLPAPTLLAITLSDQLTIYWQRTLVVLALLVIVTIATVSLFRSYSVANRLFGRFAAGTTSNLAAMSAFTSALAELLILKAPIPVAIRYAGTISHHPYFKQLSEQFAADACQPAKLRQSLSAERWPPLLIEALRSGEAGEPNVRMLRALASVYSDRIGARIDIGSDLLPAIATFFIGITVAYFIIALFMPLVSLVTALS
jgi:type IV pilus assembly protein PilC